MTMQRLYKKVDVTGVLTVLTGKEPKEFLVVKTYQYYPLVVEDDQLVSWEVIENCLHPDSTDAMRLMPEVTELKLSLNVPYFVQLWEVPVAVLSATNEFANPDAADIPELDGFDPHPGNLDDLQRAISIAEEYLDDLNADEAHLDDIPDDLDVDDLYDGQDGDLDWTF